MLRAHVSQRGHVARAQPTVEKRGSLSGAPAGRGGHFVVSAESGPSRVSTKPRPVSVIAQTPPCLGHRNFRRSCGCADRGLLAAWRVSSEAMCQHEPLGSASPGDARGRVGTRLARASGWDDGQASSGAFPPRPRSRLQSRCGGRPAIPCGGASPARALTQPPSLSFARGAVGGRMRAANQLAFPRGSALGSRPWVCGGLQPSAAICHLCRHLPLGGTDPRSRGGEPIHNAV